MGRPGRVSNIILLILVLTMLPAFDDARQQLTEHEMKALYILRFIEFTEWPDSPGREPIKLGLLREDPFGDFLTTAAQEMGFSPQDLSILEVEEQEAILRCNILYIPKKHENYFNSLKQEIGDLPILTITEAAQTNGSEAIITFFPLDQYLRFSINQQAANQARIKFKSRLLSLAYKVYGE